jgi:predicted nucleotidyltransferase
MGIDEVVRARRDAILEIAAKHGASNVRVFGSVARNEARPDSDVDVLVDLEPGRTLLDHAALMIDLENLLGRKVDVAVDGGLKERIRERVLAEAVPL